MKEQSAKMKTYLDNLISGNIKTKQLRLLEYIFNYTAGTFGTSADEFIVLKGDPKDWLTIVTMKRDLQMPHQSLTASLSALEDLGLVKVMGQVVEEKNVKSTYSIFTFVKDLDERQRLIEERIKEKYLNWANYGLKHFKFMIPPKISFELDWIISESQKPKTK